ncbi:MAG TPA: thioredoxin [Flavilitoribacter sp.]|nr:thioredoxin [Flavilitoribacter sp.]HMQ87398.1 thioredoxin [Flavilitoribacter sp.]
MDFQKDVIDQSYHKPVVVDFWAPWCGPCRVLGPVIEQLAAEQSNAWSLVKVNTEEEEEIAAQFRIMSIPHVKMFFQGEPVAEFTGSLPRRAIESWLEEHLPNEQKDRLYDLIDAVHGQEPGALEELESFVKEEPEIREARLALAQALVYIKPTYAKGLVADIDLGDPMYDAAEDVRTLGQLMEMETAEGPAAEALKQAADLLRKGEEEPAIQQIIRAVTVDKNYENGLPRRAAIALFHIWGVQHPLTAQYRRRFDMALY